MNFVMAAIGGITGTVLAGLFLQYELDHWCYLLPSFVGFLIAIVATQLNPEFEETERRFEDQTQLQIIESNTQELTKAL